MEGGREVAEKQCVSSGCISYSGHTRTVKWCVFVLTNKMRPQIYASDWHSSCSFMRYAPVPLLPTPFLSTRNTTNILVEWLGKCQVDWCVIRYWRYTCRLAFRLITWLAFWAALTHKTCVYEVSDVAAWYSVWRTRLVIYYTWRWRLFQRRLLCSYRCWFMNMNIVEWRWFFLRRRVLI